MDSETKEKIFDPFFSTKEAGQGSGLGLASLYGIIKNHGGFVNVHSEKGKGTTFNIHLPAIDICPQEEESIEAEPEFQYGQGTVLLVDDEKMILEVGQVMIEKLGSSAETALAEVNWYCREPGYAMSYLLGKHLVKKLRSDCEKAAGETFNQRDFHDSLLAQGSIPVWAQRKVCLG